MNIAQTRSGPHPVALLSNYPPPEALPFPENKSGERTPLVMRPPEKEPLPRPGKAIGQRRGGFSLRINREVDMKN